ncbi:O-antigen ligase family protein [Candidatus Pelagibacter sp. RS39]|uniref:O-antigen ligase family protein n=1 Tax=Candidatus Pelagibacter sp. RS39 TaxID=1977864 RepID=UPI000A154223|nr:O-antigen ligase family protein [Candidatus Pelagibacter sp. RS39]ARJ47527.1 hypothetical protein B5L73_01670 [Candidatus Pelagibacter sp. RS39]
MISKKLDIKDNFIIILFATLPIAIIIGNFFINFYLLSIFILFIFNVLRTKNFTWLKNKNFIILSILYLYLCLNSFVNYYINQSFGYDGILRSLLFLKFLILFPAIPLLLNKKEILDKIFKFWLFIIFIIIIDIFFEKFTGSNMLGFKSLDGTRITSFFYDENVVGTFLFSFGFITTIFFFQNKLTKKYKIILNSILILVFFSILITGERSAFLKSTILFLLIFYFIDERKLILRKFHLLILTILLATSLFFIFPTVLMKQTEFFYRILNVEKPKTFFQRFENIKYFAHYDTAIEIFKNNKLNGVGNKNFRFECYDKRYFKENLKFTHQRCTTHPHQIHFELLSEQGLLGYFIFFLFLYSFFKKKLFNDFKEKNIFKNIINFYLIIFLIPILPSGSLFSTFNGFLFWFFLGLANLKKTN